MSAKRRGRVSFADPGFSATTSLSSLPPVEAPAPSRAPLNELAHNPHNPRDGYDDDNIAELAESMAGIGQLQPAAVVSRDVFLAHYPDDAESIGAARWVVMTGNRRLTAARRAGLSDLAIAVQDRLGDSTDAHLVEATLVENIHREALPPLLEARELQALVEQHGSQSAVAKRVSKTDGWVSQRLSLLRLTEPLQELLRTGGMTFKEARTVASKPVDEQQGALEALRAPTTTALTPAPATTAKQSRGRPQRRDPRPVDVEAIARDLQQRLTADERAELIELLGGQVFTG